jgi:CRP-like cAMP-binding protein
VTFFDFQAHPVFSTFPETVLRHIYDLMEIKEYPAGYTVLKEGEDGDSFFVVASGTLEVRKVVDRVHGEYKALTRISEKEIFGEMAVFDQTPRSADVVAITDVTLWQITVPCLQDLIRANPTTGANFLMAMITLLITRLRATNKIVGAIAEAGRLVSSSQYLPALTHNLFELITREIPGADSAILALYNWFSDEFNVVESMGGDSRRALPMSLDASNQLVFRLTRSAEPILMNRKPFSDLDVPPSLEGLFSEAHSLLAAPFWYGNNLFGFVVLMNFNQTGAFTQQQLVLLDGLCHLVAPAMETFRTRSDEASRVRLARAKGFTS